MDKLINLTCWTLFFVLIAFEFSPYISTKNIFKKLAILVMAISALALSDYTAIYVLDSGSVLVINPAILWVFLFGALVFFGACTIRTYYRAIQNKEYRRATDG